MADNFDKFRSGLDSPAEHAAAVTPNDSTDLTTSTRALFIGTSGNLKVDMVGGETVTFSSVPAGVFPVRVKRVHSTGTTASGIVAMW